MALTIDKIFNAMPNRFNPEGAGDLSARIQFIFDDEKWFVDIGNGVLKSGKGELDNPTATVKTSKETWAGLVSGKVNGMMAMLSGRLKISGNMGHVMKLQDKNILRR